MALDFPTKKAYTPPPWASRIDSIPSHTFFLGQFPTPIHKWNLPNLPPNTEQWYLRALSRVQLKRAKTTFASLYFKVTRSSLGGDVQSCKRCRRSESISNMLICDRCEEAFHVKCCKPRVVFPVDDWFCGSCSKIMSEKLQNDSFLKSPSSMGLRFGLTCKFELGPIAVMLKYPEPFTSKVRIGEAYQAEVPDWCDQTPKTPLSEVETDDGVSSLAVVLDPSHSDYAVPPPLMGSENGIASRKRKLEMVESP